MFNIGDRVQYGGPNIDPEEPQPQECGQVTDIDGSLVLVRWDDSDYLYVSESEIQLL